MSKDNWTRVEHLYHHASELNGKERQAYLDLELGDDKALRREVESLLANDEQAGSFLETRAPSRGASDEAPIANMTRPSMTIGTHLGPYEILSLIDSGGMGHGAWGRFIAAAILGSSGWQSRSSPSPWCMIPNGDADSGAGSPFRIFGRDLRLRWSWDKKSLFLQLSSTGAGGVTAANGTTYIVPLPPRSDVP